MEMISKDEVIKALQKWNCRDAESLTINPYEVLRDIPTIEERKEGMWIDKGRDDDVYDIKGVKTWATKGMCSECGFTTWFIESHMCYVYCPQCGSYNATKMKGE